MKIAITGKGGVGKTTLAGLLSHLYAKDGRKVIAVDADPDANLPSALGVSQEEMKKIRPLADMQELIEERTGAKTGGMGGMFRMNPRVDDLPEGIGYHMNGITLITMGKLKAAASGCYCPEHVLLRNLLRHLILERKEVIILDMEAGIEHMTRGTAEAVDAFIVVVEPGQRSLQTARAVLEMANTLGVPKVFAVANKVRGADDLNFIRDHVGSLKLIGTIGFHASVLDADIKGLSPYHSSAKAVDEVRYIKNILEEEFKHGSEKNSHRHRP